MTDLTKQEAYLAMYAFLEEQYRTTKSDDIGSLLGGMSFLEDGKPVDMAEWEIWLESIEKVKQGGVQNTV